MPDKFMIPVRIDHLPASIRREAALWCSEEIGIDKVEVMRPLEIRNEQNGLCQEVVACFWFENQKDANWFALRWL
jgi:hypothetical protein